MVQSDLLVLCDHHDTVDEYDRYKGIPTLVVPHGVTRAGALITADSRYRLSVNGRSARARRRLYLSMILKLRNVYGTIPHRIAYPHPG